MGGSSAVHHLVRSSRPRAPPKIELKMADNSTIEWTEATWNPTTGCDRVSPGCDNCYALRLAKRLKHMGAAKYQLDGSERTSGPGFGLQYHEHTLEIPHRWRRGRMIFVNSMSDLFHPEVPLEAIQSVFEVMTSTPQHTYQVLTKRSRRLAKVAAELPWADNIWMGVSIESTRYAFRADHLRETPAAVKFISAEPLLGLLELDLDGLDWVIAGGESGPGFRPLKPEWLRDLRDNCRAAKVLFFFKQWGGRTPKAGGRELDGQFWNELPA